MEKSHGVTGPSRRDPQDTISEQLKRNDDVFKNTMEAIFQKYSNLDDPGPDVCLETMTFRTRTGVVSLHSAEAEQELQHLRNRAEQSSLVLDNSKYEQMDVTQRTENDFDSSLQTENCDVSQWHGSETSQLSVNSGHGSRSCLWDLTQPEEEDEDLERTLSSHNKTLLDVYPSMLNQIGEAYRRQHVTKAANAVLRRYRRQRCQSSQAQHRIHGLSNSFSHTLNRTIEISHNDLTGYHEDLSSYEEAQIGRNRQEPSPMKINNSFLASSRSDQELLPLMTIQSLPLASFRSSQELPSLKAIRNVSNASNSKKQEVLPLMIKRNVSLASIRSNQELSPLKSTRNAPLATSSSSRVLSPLKAIRNAPLATSSSSRVLSPLKAIRNASLTTSSSNQGLSPLKSTQNAPLAISSSSRVLSPLKAIRNASLTTTSSNQGLSPLKASQNSSYAATTSNCNQEFSLLKAYWNSSLASGSSNQELSPLKATRNPPIASSACFYSPRRADGENSPATESRSHWTRPDLHLDSKPPHQPVRVLDFSAPPSSAYSHQTDVMPESNGVLPSAVWSPSKSICNSPLKRAAGVSLTGQGGRSVIPSPSHHCPAQLRQRVSGGLVERECSRDCLYSSVPSPRKALTGSPLKTRIFSSEQETSSISYPKQTVHGNRSATLQMCKSPYLSKQEVLSSSYHSPHVSSEHQENLALPEVLQHSNKLMKRQRSSMSHMSGHQSTSSSVSHMSSRQIDAEFRKLYHHFICQGNSSSCRTSSCHLCERQSQKGNQTPPSIFSNMSPLAPTSVGSQLRKRRRQSEGEESLRMKRFCERWSPKQQQQTKYTSAAMVNPSEEKSTWNRALLLQCPSPVFLRARGSTKNSSRSQTSLQNHSYSQSWRDTSGSVGAAEASSPVRAWNPNGVSLTPSMSRRRLLYGPLQ